ncbi:hypothetical protein [Nocardia sp. NPDC049526]|uniref:hypothetical protein n=1 Tax=Nocardia sp. NPDC049526 TaxID=3364316 RepID=UPI00378C35B1
MLDRHFARIWDEQMSPPWRRQYRRRTGRPNYRLIRYADNFIVLVHGTEFEAEDLESQISLLLAERLKMTLSDETHINDGFMFLGFRIQAKTRAGGRREVLTVPPKNALGSVMHKIKTLTKRGTISLSDGKLDHSCHCWEHFDVRMLYPQGRSAPM